MNRGGKKAQAPAERVTPYGVGPTRKDVVVGPDGRWMARGYVPTPVYTKKEPKP